MTRERIILSGCEREMRRTKEDARAEDKAKWKRRCDEANERIRLMATDTKEELWARYLPDDRTDVPLSCAQWDSSSVSEDEQGKAILEVLLCDIETAWTKVEEENVERHIVMMAGLALEAGDQLADEVPALIKAVKSCLKNVEKAIKKKIQEVEKQAEREEKEGEKKRKQQERDAVRRQEREAETKRNGGCGGCESGEGRARKGGQGKAGRPLQMQRGGM